MKRLLLGSLGKKDVGEFTGRGFGVVEEGALLVLIFV
jgi:hypothetical protein